MVVSFDCSCMYFVFSLCLNKQFFEDGTEDPSTLNPGSSITKKKSKSKDANKEKKERIQMDMIVILTSLLLQDGPLFCLRMTLIFKYVSIVRLSREFWIKLQKLIFPLYRFQVISHMNIFFTCKNTLVIMLQLYRLLILCLERRPVYRRQSRIFSLIPSEAFEDSLGKGYS